MRAWWVAAVPVVALILLLALAPSLSASASFGDPIKISTDAAVNDNDQPQIAVDSNGFSHVTWYGYDDFTPQIYYADNASGWPAPPTKISTDPGVRDNFEPQIAVDSNGFSHVAWRGYDGRFAQIYYADNVSGWPAAPTKISTDPGVDKNEQPQIAVDRNGFSHVTWRGYDGGFTQIYYADNVSGWPAAPTKISTDPGVDKNRQPQIAVDPNGFAHVTWHGLEIASGSPDIYYADNVSGWPAAPTKISTDPGVRDNFEPQIAVDRNGFAHVTWYGYESVSRSTQVYYADNVSGWPAAPTKISTDPGVDKNEQPQIAVDPNGFAHVTWRGHDGRFAQIYYADNVSGWPAAPTKISTDPGVDKNEQPQIAVDSNGFSHVTWYGYESASRSTQVYHADNTTGWPATPTLVSTDPSVGGNDNPQIAVDPSGSPHITWRWADQTGMFQIYYNGPVPATPTVTTSAATSVTGTGATLNGVITDTGGGECDVRGFRYRRKGDTAWTDLIETGGFGAGAFNRPVTGLAEGTTYEFLAGACNSGSGIYGMGDTLEFTTKARPEVATRAATSVTVEGATLNGEITDTGGDTCDSRGFRYRRKGSTEWTDAYDTGTPGGEASRAGAYGPGAFDKLVTGLASGATYEFQARAHNPLGWGTGETMEFKTLPEPETHTWYLAEGSTAWGFDTYISIVNPNREDLEADVTFMKSDRSRLAIEVGLPGNSQTTVNPRDYVGDKDFSTKVECIQGRTIAVDRTMSWTGPKAASPEGHSSIGVTSPARTWYLPEGSSQWGFETWLLIQNPNQPKATCTVTYMMENKGPKVVKHDIPGHSRQTFNMADDIGEFDASIKVESDVGVIAERAMYRNDRREGHESIGTTTPATDYYLAEGTTGWGFTTYVLVQNPNDSEVDVDITYMTPSGPWEQPRFKMAADSRKTVRVNDLGPVSNTDLSVKVHGSAPIIAERAMYWDSGTGEACHDSIGLSAPHASFCLPDGQTSGGRETWTLVQNPNDEDVTIEIRYLSNSDRENVTFTDTVKAHSRKTYVMAEKGVKGRAGVQVTCLTQGKKIMAERAMYWNSRGAGTVTIGGFRY